MPGCRPACLQTDLTTLKDAAPADTGAQAAKIISTALSALAGGYGAKIQKLIERIQAKVGSSTAPGTTS